MSDKVIVSKLPKCDFTHDEVDGEVEAHYDFKTLDGRWGNGCSAHYVTHRAYNRLGTGMGQRLIVDGPLDEGDDYCDSFKADGSCIHSSCMSKAGL